MAVVTSTGLWGGVGAKYGFPGTLTAAVSMCFVGLLEDVIFRGLLFRAMEKENLKSAVIVSSLTFGLGHIVNLLNGAEFLPTLIQIIYAVSLGYLFVTIFMKSKSLIPCILTHIVINSTSVFNVENNLSTYIAPIIFIIIPIAYSIYINKQVKE